MRETLSKEHEGLRVIACGGGVVESEGAREVLVEVGQENCRVVHIERDIDDIVAYLEASDDSGRRPGYGESVRSVGAGGARGLQTSVRTDFTSAKEMMTGVLLSGILDASLITYSAWPGEGTRRAFILVHTRYA